MRCFDGSEQQRSDLHTSRAQRARGRCAIVHLKPRVVWTWRFSKKITGFVTSRSESRPKLPQHGYHSIVAPCALPPAWLGGGIARSDANSHLGPPRGPPRRRVTEPTNRRARKRRENKPALSPLIARIVPGAVRECDVPVPLYSAFRLLSSLSYSHAWPFAVA